MNVLRLGILVTLDVAISFTIARYVERRYRGEFGGVFVLAGLAILAFAVLVAAPLVWTST
jgi:hypothetical protein